MKNQNERINGFENSKTKKKIESKSRAGFLSNKIDTSMQAR